MLQLKWEILPSCYRKIDFDNTFYNITLNVFNDSANDLKKVFLEKDENDRTAFALAAFNNPKETYESNFLAKFVHLKRNFKFR